MVVNRAISTLVVKRETGVGLAWELTASSAVPFRIALSMIEDAEASGKIQPGKVRQAKGWTRHC